MAATLGGPPEKLLPVAIEAYDGDTTAIELHWYDPTHEPVDLRTMWAILAVSSDAASIVAYGYRSRDEVLESIEALAGRCR